MIYFQVRSCALQLCGWKCSCSWCWWCHPSSQIFF
jgi:hypothetical protein